MKKRTIYAIFMAVFAFLILLNWGIHAYRTDVFNSQLHSISEKSTNDEVTFTFEPQNNTAISWKKETTVNGVDYSLYACCYDGILTNYYDAAEVSTWTMRLDINCNCYINQSWCGTAEIHQHVNGVDVVQTLDLRDLNEDEIELNYCDVGDIILFPLKPGDYIIYHPSMEDNEYPLESNTRKDPDSVGTGFIFYWDQDSEFIDPDYEVDYQYHKGYFDGTNARISEIASIVWGLLLIIGFSVDITDRIISKKAEYELSKKIAEKKTAEKMLDEMIRALAYSIDAKDKYTHGHSERVAQYSLELAEKLELSSEECKQIFYAGLVHDVGKIGVPEEIINKNGKLTDEEFGMIKKHPEYGEKILLQIKDMPYLSIGAKYHHEKFDGSGYPDHKKGEEIPFMARIIAVADAYDAMTSRRSYRDTLDQKIVKQEIYKGMGTQFDPVVAKQMIAMIDADVDYNMREKSDENYDIIDNINNSDFWQDYNPKSIKSEETIMADTSMKTFTEFIYSVDHWLNPVSPVAVTEAGTEVSFTSTTDSDAKYVWETPSVILYTSDDGKPAGSNFVELGVFESSGYSWKWGDTISERMTLNRKEAFGNWNNWNEKNKTGLKYTVRVKKENNSVKFSIENELVFIEGEAVLPENYGRPIYFCLTGESCSISDIS